MRNSGLIAIAIVFLVVLFAQRDSLASGVVDWYADGSHIAQRAGLNLVGGDGLTVTGADAPGDSRVNVTLDVQLTTGDGAPGAGDCDSAGEAGALYLDTTGNALYACLGASGWASVGLTP